MNWSCQKSSVGLLWQSLRDYLSCASNWSKSDNITCIIMLLFYVSFLSCLYWSEKIQDFPTLHSEFCPASAYLKFLVSQTKIVQAYCNKFYITHSKSETPIARSSIVLKLFMTFFFFFFSHSLLPVTRSPAVGPMQVQANSTLDMMPCCEALGPVYSIQMFKSSLIIKWWSE